MRRYYFDLRDDQGLAVDEEGLELRDIQVVQVEAARALSDVARDAVLRKAVGADGPVSKMVIEVRDDDGPVVHVKFRFEIDRKN